MKNSNFGRIRKIQKLSEVNFSSNLKFSTKFHFESGIELSDPSGAINHQNFGGE